MDFQVAYKASTKHAIVQVDGHDVPATYENIGTFSDASNLTLGTDPNVAYHYVRDLLYAEGETDMAGVTIQYGPQSINIGADKTIDLSDAETYDVSAHLTVVPSEGYAGVVTYASSDPTKATVNANTGVVTPVAAGTTNITATSSISGRTDVIVITVQA
jgi:hypothetical protein